MTFQPLFEPEGLAPGAGLRGGGANVVTNLDDEL
ncbi:MAG: hypothetical protein JWP74_48 [Marmoricola sp.]|nr:hypothetical protein [Marmoricola sp.]